MNLRPYQLEAVQDVYASWENGARAPLLQLPTGAGKTVVFSHITKQHVERTMPVVVLVHRKELLSQSVSKLQRLRLPVGTIQAGRAESTDLARVASIDTLARRVDKRQYEAHLVIIDECHHVAASTWRKVVDAFPEARLLGTTATPKRRDGKGLGVDAGGVFDTLIHGPQSSDLIAEGYLAQPRVFRPPSNLDMTGARKRFGDWAPGEVEKRVAKSTIHGDAVEHYRKHLDGKPSIAYGVSVAHAEQIATDFRAKGFIAESLHAKSKDREEVLARFASGEIHVLANCDLFGEGLDIEGVAGVILLRPTQSLGLYLQQVGRAMRPDCECVVLDHVGNTNSHGMPDEDRIWSLDGSVERPGRLKLRTCMECFAVYEAGKKACPQCGAVPTAGERVADLEQTEGELEEAKEDQQRKERVKAQVRAACSLEELAAIGAQMGYKPGWERHQWKIKQRYARVRGAQVYGNLTVLSSAPKGELQHARAQCLCGREWEGPSWLLKLGRVTNCGCKMREAAV